MSYLIYQDHFRMVLALCILTGAMWSLVVRNIGLLAAKQPSKFLNQLLFVSASTLASVAVMYDYIDHGKACVCLLMLGALIFGGAGYLLRKGNAGEWDQNLPTVFTVIVAIVVSVICFVISGCEVLDSWSSYHNPLGVDEWLQFSAAWIVFHCGRIVEMILNNYGAHLVAPVLTGVRAVVDGVESTCCCFSAGRKVVGEALLKHACPTATTFYGHLPENGCHGLLPGTLPVLGLAIWYVLSKLSLTGMATAGTVSCLYLLFYCYLVPGVWDGTVRLWQILVSRSSGQETRDCDACDLNPGP